MNFKYNTKQRNKSVQGLRSFKDTLPQEAKRILNKKGQIYSNTLDNWKFLVGKELFNVCYPISYKNSKLNGSCLSIMVKRGNEVELEYSKKEILIKNKKVICIGDSLNTDIKGANIQNFDSLLITSGIHKNEISNGIEKLVKKHEVNVNYIQKDLKW